MIIVKIQHGLGNQMFQYAFGRRMAEKNGTELKLDISYYSSLNKGDTPRKYSLGCFNIVENFADKKDIGRFRANNYSGAGFFSRAARKLFRKLEGKKPITEQVYLSEAGFGFRAEILENKNKDLYLYGNWQDERYFSDIADIIRKEFTLKNGFGETASKIAEKIKNARSVSVHIRRGDYESNPRTRARLGPLPPEYYAKAMEIISEKELSPVFFVFSDDIEWAKKELKPEFQTEFVGGENISDCEELALMSLCKHNIIANSSFSWWGAWLNGNPNKIVIAPQRWFADPKSAERNPCPKDWIKI